jgi:putative membrane protein
MEELMLVRWLLAALHLLGLGIGLGAIYVRARTLGGPLDRPALQRAFLADTFWGVAAALWIITGLIRAFGPYEKGSAYYLQSDAFMLKMGLLILILILEVWPMVTLIRWRGYQRRNETFDTAPAGTMARISWVQIVLVILMVFAATALADGYGMEIW